MTSYVVSGVSTPDVVTRFRGSTQTFLVRLLHRLCPGSSNGVVDLGPTRRDVTVVYVGRSSGWRLQVPVTSSMTISVESDIL